MPLCTEALETKPMVQKYKYIKIMRATMHFAAFSRAVITKQQGKQLLA